MNKLNYILIALVLGAFALGIFGAMDKRKVEVVKTEVVTKEIAIDLSSLTGRISGMEKKMEILEKGFSAIIGTLQVIAEKAQNLGGLVHNVREIFSDGLYARPLIQGGKVTTITAASSTLTAAQMCNSAIIKFSTVDSEVDGDIVYFASSTHMIANCLPTIGDSKQILFWNFSSSTYTLRFGESWVGAKTELLQTSTSTDPAGSTPRYNLDKGEYTWVTYQNLDGATSTITFVPLAE